MCPSGYHPEPGQKRPQRQRFLGSSVSRDGRHGKIRELTVNGDAHEIADLLDFAASQAERAQVPENEVVVGSASLEFVAMLREGSREGTGVEDNLLSIRLERGLSNLEESSGDSSNSLRIDKYGKSESF